jgi:hypothetical protein
MREPIVPASVVLAAALAASAAGAQTTPAEEPRKYHAVDAEVVSASVDAMTLTVKVAGEEQTEHVSALARTRLSRVKAGDKVVLSCKDVGGEHKEIVAIRPAKADGRK